MKFPEQIVVLVLAACCLSGPAWSAAEVGKDAPPISVAADNGRVNLAELRGKVVYVDFWASWCGPCRASFKWLNEAQEKYGPKGLVVIGINVDKDRELALQFLKEVPARFRIGYDPDGVVAQNYQLKGMPSTYLIDRKGQLRVSHVGYRAKDKELLAAELEKLLAE